MTGRRLTVVFPFLFFLSIVAMTLRSSSSPAFSSSSNSTALISFLQELQAAALVSFGRSNFDPKLYVDLPLKSDLQSTRSAFQGLRKLSNGSVPVEELRRFVAAYFDDAGSDLVSHVPPDFKAEPEGFLSRVEDPAARKWALEVHSLWRLLSRKVSERVADKPERHTLLPLREPVVVPGSRFREVYYWDSYWVIRGLLASKMHQTAKSIVRNLVSMIEKYGFVLNGARSYYTNRSQPPLLSSMVMEIYKSTRDVDFVKETFPYLLKEHGYWNSKIHRVVVHDAQGHSHTLNRYNARWNNPRPESGTTDEATASNISSITEKELLYHELASTAESGWDFSTRWMSSPPDLTTLRTTSIIPVDLNTYILKMELDLAHFAIILGNASVSEAYEAASKLRIEAMNSVFWNAERGQWLDYWFGNSSTSEETHTWQASNQNQNVFASNFVPLWIGSLTSGDMVKKAASALVSSGLLKKGGILTSLTNSGQQWDAPNGWPPMQHLIVEGLVKSNSDEAKILAKDIALRWLRINYDGYKQSGKMHEKYNVEECGTAGGGGEYSPQTGFGWSNGVVLAFLEEFGWPNGQNLSCPV
ncbi:putative trehalase [Nymphaea thermarum]|nr:putative trehalase [Nymphaea thermarum]